MGSCVIKDISTAALPLPLQASENMAFIMPHVNSKIKFKHISMLSALLVVFVHPVGLRINIKSKHLRGDQEI